MDVLKKGLIKGHPQPTSVNESIRIIASGRLWSLPTPTGKGREV